MQRAADEFAADYEKVFGEKLKLSSDSPRAVHKLFKRLLANNPVFSSGSDETCESVGNPNAAVSLVGYGTSSKLRKNDTDDWGPAQKLIPYKDYLCSVQNDACRENALMIILCGHLPEKRFYADNDRCIFLIGKAEHLGKSIPFAERPLINIDFQKYSAWNGAREIPQEELITLRNLISKTHDEGKWFRIYFAPDTEAAHRLFYREGVDFIRTDNMVTLCTVLQGEV